MAEKIVVTKAEDAEEKINPLLEKGWKIKSMISENVAVSLAASERFGSERKKVLRGAVIFSLEKS